MCSPRFLQDRPRARYTGLLQTGWPACGEGWGYPLKAPHGEKIGPSREGFSQEPSLFTARVRPNKIRLAVVAGRQSVVHARTTIPKKTVSSFFRCGILPQLPTDICRGSLVAGYRK